MLMSIRGLNEVLKDRQETYGSPEEAFTRIGRMWGAILNTDDIPAHEVDLMMIALKIIRIANNPQHEDSWLDLSGYIQHGRKIVGIDES